MSSNLPRKIMMREDGGPPVAYDVLDLYDLALLLNYERYAREPRFRRSMLADVARGGQDFYMFPEIIRLSNWISAESHAERLGFMFKIEDFPFDEDQPDLATRADMLPTNIVPPRIQALTDHELETIFYQSRSHDSCFATILLLQYLFELYPEDQPVCVRTDDGLEFITHMYYHHTAIFTLQNPKTATVSVVLRGNPTYHQEAGGRTRMHLNSMAHVTGHESSMKHCAMVFVPPPEDSDLGRLCKGRAPRDGVVLDLASMQFGEAGRGLRGRSLFVLEPMENFKARMLVVAETAEGPATGGAMRENAEYAWLKDVARRAKERYDRRETEHWCGHCGTPTGRLACKCQAAWYCDKAHQKAAWPFHKHYCSVPPRGLSQARLGRSKERCDRGQMEHWCGHCGAPAGRFACKCQAAWYCDEAHQKAAWPFHKQYCSVPSQGLFQARLGRSLFLIAVGYMFFKALPSIRRNWYQ